MSRWKEVFEHPEIHETLEEVNARLDQVDENIAAAAVAEKLRLKK